MEKKEKEGRKEKVDGDNGCDCGRDCGWRCDHGRLCVISPAFCGSAPPSAPPPGHRRPSTAPAAALPSSATARRRSRIRQLFYYLPLVIFRILPLISFGSGSWVKLH